MKKKDYLIEIRALGVDELKARARDISEELMKLRFRKSVGQVEAPHLFSELKVKLARVETILAEKRAAA